MSRVVLAMSGGVDSSVAAHLLLEQGHDVIGVFMRHGHQSPVACGSSAADPPSSAATSASLPIVDRLDHKQGCCTAADAEDARRVADRLAIPFYALDLNREFEKIIGYFVAEYSAGRTPNPCVRCNDWIKFGKLFDYADGVGAEFVATGHYARLAFDASISGASRLLRGIDDSKDQSYVLFGVQRELLPRMLLPVGSYEKSEIRRLARGIGLNVAAKKDSQEICFVTSGHYADFVKSQRERDADDSPRRGGEFTLVDGTVVGRHDGIEGFTVGQRKGLGVALGEPRFVVRIEPETQRVVLGTREESGRRDLTAGECNWLIDPVELPPRCEVQIRYNAPAAAATVRLAADGRLNVRFDQPQFAVAPGQAAVCYQGDRVLGGGWIE